jgi:hypothetical protein
MKGLPGPHFAARSPIKYVLQLLVCEALNY